MTKWLFVATLENWQTCLERRTWGVKDRYKTTLQRIKAGDQILIHLTENKTAGICKVVREYFEDNSIMWEGDEIYRHRIGIEPLKLPPHPIDAKYSYDKYLRAEQGSSRGYFGNAIREISDHEFSIFESDIDRSIEGQNAQLKVDVNEDKPGKRNNDAYKDSRMKLEQAIELTKEKLQNEPDRIKDEQSVIDKYSTIFNPNNIDKLTKEDFISFLSYKYNKHWNFIHRYSSKITANMEKLRSVLKEVLDESKPINERLDAVVMRDGESHIGGLGKAVLTPILLVAYPEKYAVYNQVTEDVMKYFDIYPDFFVGETFGERYVKINEIINDIAKKSNLSLWQMDHVWDIIGKFRNERLDEEFKDNERIEPNTTTVYLTAYDDANLKISRKFGMLGWKDRPSQLSVGDYVFVYNIETDKIESCFEIKSLSKNQDAVWHEEITSPSSNPVYPYRWNAIVKAVNLDITNDTIFGFQPFKSDKKNFSMLIRNKHPRSLSGMQYNEFRNFLLDTIEMSTEQDNYLLLLNQPDTKWEDKEGTEYHYGNNVPNYTKITPNSKVIFCRYNNSNTLVLGYAQVESIIEENKGRTTHSGRPIIEKFAKIKDYKKFSPPRSINSTVQASLAALPNYNNQHAIIPITKDIYKSIIADGDVINNWSFDIEKAVDEILLQDTDMELAIDRRLVKRILLHLKAGKHVILVGAPGIGKTDLARRILETIGKKVIGNDSFLESVASDEWSRYELIGGLNLDNEFQEGWVTKAANTNQWLLIDEFNRANMNKAFGELFLAIEYHKIRLRPTESKNYKGKDTIEIPQNFRMICTMNDFDKNLLLTELSYGLINRFAFVVITPDIHRESIVVERRVKSLLRDDATYEKCLGQIKLYFEFINYVRKERTIDVRTSIDVVKYLISAIEGWNYDNSDDSYKWLSLNDALCDYVLPQFDRLDGKTIDSVLKYAESTLAREDFKPFKDELQKISSRLQKAAGWLNRKDDI